MILAVWLILWQAAAALIHNRIIFVGPREAVLALVSQIGTAEFWRTVASSFFRIAGGFTGAFLAGILTAALAGRFSLLREFLEPPAALLQSVPVASFVILALIWIGSENLSILITCVVVFPVIYRNVLEGIRQTDRKMLEMAQVFRMGVWKKIWYLYRPAVMPYLLAGCRISLGMAWKSGVAAEVIGVPDHSIGEKLYMAKIYLSTAELFAWTFVIIVVSRIFERLFLWLLGRFVPERSAARSAKAVRGGGNVRENRSEGAGTAKTVRGGKNVGENRSGRVGTAKAVRGGGNVRENRSEGAGTAKAVRGGGNVRENRSEGAGTVKAVRGGENVRENRSEGAGTAKAVRGGQSVTAASYRKDSGNPADASPVLAAEAVSKAYRGIPVLEEENLRIGRGDIYCLMGPSGRGKTTLLRLLMGLERPDDGRITGSGRKRISAVFQEDRLCGYLSGIDNIRIVSGRDGLWCDPRELLSLFLDPEALERPARELSGGMKRRVAIARALAVSSEVVLMDEPFTGLDEETRIQAAEAIRANLNGRALLLVTHQAEDARRLGAELIHLKEPAGFHAGGRESDKSVASWEQNTF